MYPHFQIPNFRSGYIRIFTCQKQYVMSLPEGILHIIKVQHISNSHIVALCHTIHGDIVRWIELPDILQYAIC